MPLPGQRPLFDSEPPARHSIKVTTYIYIRQDGKCVHVNAAGPYAGKEYEHDNPNWQPGPDWPYEVKDVRKERG